MKVRGKVVLTAGENERFSPTVAQSLIGQMTEDGWTVIDARRENHQTIWLTVERDV
jgi:hypothetical protein